MPVIVFLEKNEIELKTFSRITVSFFSDRQYHSTNKTTRDAVAAGRA